MSNVTPIRPREEVSRMGRRLPAKSRRHYKRNGGHRYRNVGRYQQPMRWYVMGKVIIADWRPCYRCMLGSDACATCQHPRREAAKTEEAQPA